MRTLFSFPSDRSRKEVIRLFLRFLEDNVLSQLFAVLFKLDLARDELAILARPIDLAGRCVFELYQLIL
jgi:hypothetical protein